MTPAQGERITRKNTSVERRGDGRPSLDDRIQADSQEDLHPQSMDTADRGRRASESRRAPRSRSAGDSAAEFAQTLGVMVQVYRTVDMENAEVEACQHHVEVLERGIEALEVFLANPADAASEHYGRSASNVEQEIAQYRDGQNILHESAEKARGRIRDQIQDLERLEKSLFEVAFAPQFNAIKSRLPALKENFFTVLESNHIRTQDEGQHRNDLAQSTRDNDTLGKFLLRVKAKLDTLKSQPTATWKDIVPAQREKAKLEEAIGRNEAHRQAILKRLDVARRSRNRQLCISAEEAIVEAGLAPAVDENDAIRAKGPDSQEGAPSSSRSNLDPLADDAIRKDLNNARRALSDANWELQNVRATYDDRLAQFDADIAAGREQESFTRSDFDRRHLRQCQAATEHITEAEDAYNHQLKKGLDRGVIPPDWPAWAVSGFHDDGSNGYPASVEAALKAGVNKDTIKVWAKNAKGAIPPVSSDGVQASQHTPAHSPTSMAPGDSASQARFAVGRNRDRIRRWEAERGKLRDRMLNAQHTLGGHGFCTSAGTWI